MWKQVLQSEEKNLRNFKLEGIELICSAFDVLLRRVCNTLQKNEMIEKFSLEVTLRCL